MELNTTPIDLEEETDWEIKRTPNKIMELFSEGYGSLKSLGDDYYLSDKDLFNFGRFSVANKIPIVYLYENFRFHGDTNKQDLSVFEGLKLTDNNQSYVISCDTSCNVVAEADMAAYIVGVMCEYGFKYVGLYSSCLLSACDYNDNYEHKRITEPFQLTIKFYSSKPGADKAPQYLFDINDAYSYAIMRAICRQKHIIDTRFDLLMRVDPFLSEKTADAIIDAILKHEWWRDGDWEDDDEDIGISHYTFSIGSRWVPGPYTHYTDADGKEHTLENLGKGVVLCDDDGYPIAVGPDAILQA